MPAGFRTDVRRITMSRFVRPYPRPSGVVPLVGLVLLVETIHQKDIRENDRDEGVDRSLLCKPEAELESTNLEAIQSVNKENPAPQRHTEPQA